MIKSATYKVLITLNLKIAVNFGKLCLYSYFIPKNFSEDAFTHLYEAGVCFQLIL